MQFLSHKKESVGIMLSITIWFAIGFFMLSDPTAHADTSVINTVKTSASGNGAHTSITTSINGVVVEDVTIDSPTTYSSEYRTENEENSSVLQGNESEQDKIKRLEALVNTLTSLIKYYVALLKTVS